MCQWAQSIEKCFAPADHNSFKIIAHDGSTKENTFLKYIQDEINKCKVIMHGDVLR